MTPSYRRIPRVKLDGRIYPIVADLVSAAGGEYADDEAARSPEDEAADKMQKAYEAGFQAGRAASAKEADAEVSGKARALAAMIDDISSQRSRLLLESEEAVVRLACRVARRVVENTADSDPETIVKVVRAGLERVAESQKVTVRVNPADLAALKEHQAEWLAATRGGSAVEIKEDERIKRGGCLLEGTSGYIEAEIDRQVEVIERALVEAVQ